MQILLREDYGNSTLRLNRLRGLLEKTYTLFDVHVTQQYRLDRGSTCLKQTNKQTKQNKTKQKYKNKNKIKKRPIRETAELDFIRKRR